MDPFMRRAIELAINNTKEGGDPFGAVLVKDNEIISEGVNELHKKMDVSGHAELLALRRAQEKFQTIDLTDFIMYASGEPCPMCLAAMYFSGIQRVYYCQSVEEAMAAGLSKSKEIYDDLRKSKEERNLTVKQIPLQEGQLNPMRLWSETKS